MKMGLFIPCYMLDAYPHIQNTEYGYGVFTVGPSKTADTKQSLVIGAHGARSLTIFI